ncbi:MAG: NUDIX pyrophosphatase [Bacteroidetes bacterium]|nr:NUDIX pyrophosphatase [Bacteroidota bacterium]
MPDVSVRVVDVYPYRLRPDGQAEWLVLRRAAGLLYAGQWRVVGGKIEPGETAHAAALRELREETSLLPTTFWAIPSVNAFYEWTHDRVNLVPAFAAELRTAPTLDDEHDGLAWLPADEAALRLDWPEPRRLLLLADETLRRGLPPELVVPV